MFAGRTNWNLNSNRLSEALAKHRAAAKPLLDLSASNPTECGFEYDRQNFNQIGNQYPRGNYSFSPNATTCQTAASCKVGSGGDAFAEFLLGYSFQDTVAVAAADAKFQRNMEAAFIDDTWKITPKLTLSLGLRYELTPPFTDDSPRLVWDRVFSADGACFDIAGLLLIFWGCWVQYLNR